MPVIFVANLIHRLLTRHVQFYELFVLGKKTMIRANAWLQGRIAKLRSVTMVHDERDADQSAVWGTLLVILLVIIAILLIAYFAWWAPTKREVVIERNQPAKSSSSSPATAPQSPVKKPAKTSPKGENSGGQQPSNRPIPAPGSGG